MCYVLNDSLTCVVHAVLHKQDITPATCAVCSNLHMQAHIHAFMYMRMCRWMSPESIIDGVWDVRTDVWMFGVLLWGECCDHVHAVAP